jgi:hypothetical protein
MDTNDEGVRHEEGVFKNVECRMQTEWNVKSANANITRQQGCSSLDNIIIQ